jgi:hypothetical protein
VQDEPAAAAAAAQAPPTGAASRLFAEAGDTTPVMAARPASGWQEVYDACLADGVAAATPEPAAAATPEAAAASGLALDEQGCLPFFFLDAYETPDVPGALHGGCRCWRCAAAAAVSQARTLRCGWQPGVAAEVNSPRLARNAGSVYLFGKVQDQGAWRSCCAVVEGCYYSLLVVRRLAGACWLAAWLVLAAWWLAGAQCRLPAAGCRAQLPVPPPRQAGHCAPKALRRRRGAPLPAGAHPRHL